MRLTRRAFLASTAATTAVHALRAQTITAHTGVAEIEREHILASAKPWLSRNPDANADKEEQFNRTFSNAIAALTAAYLLTREEPYIHAAIERFVAWYNIESFNPANQGAKSPNDILISLPLAEILRAVSFFPDELPPDAAKLRAALLDFAALFLRSLNQVPVLQLARDSKDHRASAWLLIAAACARATRNDEQLDKLRLRFKKPTLRNQISLEGKFPQELATDNPLRNTLFNFDLLAGACQLLTSPFDDLWHYELPEGTGMRSCAAYIYPFLSAPAHWPAIADAQYFRDVPLRRPGLLFAGRAYDRAEYVQLFASLPTPNPPEEIAYSLPITQPILWTSRAPHGL